MENKFKFKKFLATASALAMITSASSAMGVAVQTTANVTLQDGSGTNLSAVFNSGVNSIKLGGKHDIMTGGDVTFNGGIDANGSPGQTFSVGHAVTATADIEMGVTLSAAGSLESTADIAGDVINSGKFTARDLKALGGGGGNGDLSASDGTSTVRNVAGAVVISDGAVVNITDTGVITGVVTTPGVGTGVLNFVVAGTANGLVGTVGNALESINAKGKGAVVLAKDTFATNLNVANVDADVQLSTKFTGDVQFSENGKVTVADNGAITGNVKNTILAVDGKYANNGQLIFTGGAGVTETIGEVDKALKLVDVINAGNVTLKGATHRSEEFKLTHANAKLIIADGGKLVGKLTGAGQAEFTVAGEIEGTIGANGAAFGNVIANGAGAVTIGEGEHFSKFTAANAGASFVMSDKVNVTGNIDNTAGVGTTAITFNGTSTVTGEIGATAAFKDINIAKGDVTTTLDVKAENINFTDASEGKLTINGSTADQNIGVAGKLIQKDVSNRGEIVIGDAVLGKNVTFLSKIGDKVTAAALERLHIQNKDANSTVTLAADSHITEIKAAGAGKLAITGDQKIGSVVPATNGELELHILANTTLMNAGSATFGTAEKTLGKLTFAGDDTLTIEDGVNIYASEVNPAANNNGTLTFKGSSVFDAVSGANTLKAMNIDGAAGSVVSIKEEIKLDAANASVILTADNTLKLGGNITAKDISGAAAHGQGTLQFVNEAASTVTSTVGATWRMKAIELSGSDVVFAKDVTHTGDITFNAKNAMQVEFNAGTDIGGAKFINDSAASVNHTVVLKAIKTTFVSEVAKGTAATKQIIFQLDDAKDADISSVDTAGAIFRTATPNKGKLDFITANGGTVHSVGASGAALESVTFTQSGTITKDVFAETIKVDAGKTAILGGTIGGTNGVALAGVGSVVDFVDGFKLDTAVVATTPNEGIVDFASGGAVNSDIGKAASRVKTVNFADVADKSLALNANIFATEGNLKKATVEAKKDVTIDATIITAANSVLDVSGGDITLNGANVTFSGANKVTAKLDEKAVGKQVVNANGVLKFAAGTTLAVQLNDNDTNRPTAATPLSFTVLKNNNVAVIADADKLSSVTTNNSNEFITWTSEILANGDVVSSAKDNTVAKITEVIGGDLDAADAANLKLLSEAAAGTAGAGIVDDVFKEILGDKEKTKEAIDRLTTVTTATDAIESTQGNVANVLGSRVGSLSGIQTAGTPVQSGLVRKTASSAVTGVAAGDDHARYGAWFSPFFSKTTQKARKSAAGYKDTAYGGSLGMDTRANDDLIIGGAFTFSNSEMKHTDRKSGDKTKVNSLMLSIYAMQQITDTWFVQGSTTVGSNDVKTSERKVAGLTTYNTVEGKYNSMSFTGDALFGYNYATEDLTLTPMAGLRYSRVNSAGHKQTGVQGADISQKASNKLEAILGAKISGGTFDVNGMSVTPEMHAFVNHDMIGKNPKQSQRIGGVATSLVAKSRNPIKTTYNLGLGVNADYGMMEYGAGYDLNLAEKRVGHEGSLKIRVNF